MKAKNDLNLELLSSVATEMQELCLVVRQNTVLSKNNAILLKRYTAALKALLLEHGIEKCSDVVEENALLVEQNAILTEQREQDTLSLLRLQEKLNVLRSSQRISKVASAG